MPTDTPLVYHRIPLESLGKSKQNDPREAVALDHALQGLVRRGYHVQATFAAQDDAGDALVLLLVRPRRERDRLLVGMCAGALALGFSAIILAICAVP